MSEKKQETPEKEYLPFQALINAIDHYVAQHEVNSEYVCGYVNGLEKMKDVCMQLLEVQEQDLKKIFELGQKNPNLDSDTWFNENYEKLENTLVKTTMKEISEEQATLNTIISPEGQYIVRNSPKYFKVILFFIFHVFSFFYFTLLTIFFILTFQFKMVSILPKLAENNKQRFKDFFKV
jgi:hypothetical protein